MLNLWHHKQYNTFVLLFTMYPEMCGRFLPDGLAFNDNKGPG